ncbi:toxin-antitoxin system YwqK family antitoxin [Chitinophagaceae bacterium MMS25-I14]
MRPLNCLIILFAFSACSSCAQDNTRLKKIEISYPNGTPKIEAFEKDGKRQGESKTFYENGQLKTQNHWDNDIQVGKTTHWFSNGQLAFEGQVENGMTNGEWKYYDEADGKYIYSVFYKDGAVSSYRYEGEKYRWRKIDLGSLNITFDFPTFLMDSMRADGGFRGYWAMFPWSKKSEIEYYSVSVIPTTENNPDKLLKQISDKKADIIPKLFHQSEEDNMIPDVRADAFKVIVFEPMTFNNRPAYKIVIQFDELKVTLESMLLPIGNDLYMISAYFNNTVGQNIKKRFWESVEIRN